MPSIREIILFSISIFLAFFIVRGCNKDSANQRDLDTLMKIHFRDSTELVYKENKLGEITTTAKAFELTQKSLDKYICENEDLKNRLSNAYKHVNSVNTTITNFHIDTIKIPVPMHDTIPCGDVDRSYSVMDRYYSFDFKFKNRIGQQPEYRFLNFNIPDTTTDVIGVKKSGFLNLRHTLVSEQIHTNKYIQIKGVKTIVKSEAKPKTMKKILIGFGLGVVATIVTEAKLKAIK